ncbi:hypothetical protein JOB18_019695 [Solea senegalensis]|uniref:Uncharacterized protein n=1 Tax=Solea senegalensis TaxID=28829 RepID=A0AAV6R323_SOLSE|nr:hypothetical protein JOB18_019695 [Solea senegalensis]
MASHVIATSALHLQLEARSEDAFDEKQKQKLVDRLQSCQRRVVLSVIGAISCCRDVVGTTTLKGASTRVSSSREEKCI